MLTGLLAAGEVKALTFYKYTFTPAPGSPNFGWRVDTSQTNPTPPVGSDPATGQNGAGVNGISLEGTIFWDGPGASTLSGSLTFQQYAGQTPAGSPVTVDCATALVCAATVTGEFLLGNATNEGIGLSFSDPTATATYDANSNPFTSSTSNSAAFPGSQANLTNDIRYFMDAGDQIGGGGTITVQELPGPLSPLALSPLLLGLRSARKRYTNLNRLASRPHLIV
ncbi:hypothetical protein FQK07_13585 [Synechococcus sp. BSF8S]|uniref:hypothetical protein n=1 Tax=Synechococcales TaxID=1890424 RepID=UPI00162808E4|nr:MULTISPECIES: hypothetical protein [unclassified Synechococcus]MBC1262273.1 hypothetical protein [Synechococcus sp. BSF8S]MBC1263436.1 hypothetical protein [Synechococcus sp. BSA11S]